MAHGNAAIGHGTTIEFASSLFANIIDFDWSGIARAAIDSTHMGSGDNKTFLSGGTYDPGGLSTTIQFNTAAQTGAHIVSALMTAAAEACTVNFNGTATFTGTAFATDDGVAAADEDVITQTVTLKFTGAITAA